MEVTRGTSQPQHCHSVVVALELELMKLQQANECLGQENAAQHKRIKAMDMKLKPLQDKNKMFLEKNIELTNINRGLESQLRSVSDEYHKLKDQCEQSKKKQKHLTQVLNQEKLDHGDLQLRYQELEGIRQKYVDQTKKLDELNKKLQEKERRINLVQHRKRKKQEMKSPIQIKYMKETAFGYDDMDVSSQEPETSLSTFSGLPLASDEICDELTTKELSHRLRHLLKEHLKLQKAHSELQSQNESREMQIRNTLEEDLFTLQCEVERLQLALSQSNETKDHLTGESISLQIQKKALEDQISKLECSNSSYQEKLTEAEEIIDNLEFQVEEYQASIVERSNDGSDTDDSAHDMYGSIIMTDSQNGATMNFHGNRVISQHMQSLEEMVRDLQVKVIQLQKENERLSQCQNEPLTVEERESKDVKAANDLPQNFNNPPQIVYGESQNKEGTTKIVKDDKYSQTVPDVAALQFDDGKSTIQKLKGDIQTLRDENAILRSKLLENNEWEEHDSFQATISEMSELCETLQERLSCSETTERQLRDKLKLAENTIRDLEHIEMTSRDLLEKSKIDETGIRRRLQDAEQKIGELKEIILDKDVYEMNISEKLLFLEKAEVLSAQKIHELEATNQLLQQRLDLKEDLEADVLLLETLKDKIALLEKENCELNAKVAELEENEEILKGNWLKVAENEANRAQLYENKIKNLEQLNSELKSRIKDIQERELSPVVPSLATELSESFKHDNLGSDTAAELRHRIRVLEEDLHETQERKDATIETLQDKMAKLKDNEIKLSESLMECEQNERELKSRLAFYEKHPESGETVREYEVKIRDMQNSREDLLDRLDSMEDHEGILKRRMMEMEDDYTRKISKLESEIASYASQGNDLRSQISYLEKHEIELVEKVKHYEREVVILKTENEHIKSIVDQNDNQNSDIENELKNNIVQRSRLEKELESLKQTTADQNEELEQLRADNEDLNERLIELDGSEQECMERMLQLEQDCKKLQHFKEKCDVLEEAESKLMDRVSELEELEEKMVSRISELEETEKSLRYQLEKTKGNVESYDQEEASGKGHTSSTVDSGIGHTDKETDTSDLTESPDQGRKLVGMFQHLQDVELQNQKINEELISLRGADNLNKHLTEKVKLLEASEDSLMERVMELEEIEDQLKEEVSKLRTSESTEAADIIAETATLRKDVELLKVNQEMLESENSDYVEKIEEYVNKLDSAEQLIVQLEHESVTYRKNMDEYEQKVCFLETNLSKSEKMLKNEQEKIESFLKGEEKLFKSIASEKTRADELERSLLELREQMANFETLKVEKEKLEITLKAEKNLEHSIEIEKHRVEDLEHELELERKRLSDMKYDHERKVSQLEDILAEVEQKEIRNLKQIDDLSSKNFKLSEENQNMAELAKENELLLKLIENNKSNEDENLESLNKKFSESRTDEERASVVVEVCNKCREAKCSQAVIPSTSDDSTDDIDDTQKCVYCQIARLQKGEQDFLRSKLENDITIQNLKFQLEELRKEKEENVQSESDLMTTLETLKSHIQELEKENSNLGGENKELHLQVSKIESNLQSSVVEFQSKERHFQAQIDSLLTSEKYLQQKLDSIESAYGSGDNSQSNDVDMRSCDWSHQEVNAPKEELLEKIQILERTNRSLECRLEYYEIADTQTDSMMDKPEDVFRQRIQELEKLEKHLKVQVTDLEKDREELYEITRKDKNTIHEQNIRIHELHLTEKTIKEQINKCEVTERELYSQIERLEDQISKMEDRISELTILEMRLKKLVHKYQLDEEVWLSKSQNLSVSLSELTVSEAQLKQHVGSLQKEKMTLAEKSEYLELRLKEVENAESSLLQRAKDQENMEISLNQKLGELQKHQTSAEMQVLELHNVNMDLSQKLNHVTQDNATLTHLSNQLQNQIQVLENQLLSVQESERKLKMEKQNLEESFRSHNDEVKDSKMKEVDMEGKIRQMEEDESILKEKINLLQRSETKLQTRIKELETQNTLNLGRSQKEKLPRKLEDCQRRILVLQNHNEELRELLNSSNMEINSVSREKLLNTIQQMEKNSLHLHHTAEQALHKQDREGLHEPELITLRNGLEQSMADFRTLKKVVSMGHNKDIMGHNEEEMIIADRSHLSQSMKKGEVSGPLADGRFKGHRVKTSQESGYPVQRLADQMVAIDDKRRELLEDQSDTSTTDEVPYKKRAQGEIDPYNVASISQHHRQITNDQVSQIEMAENYMPPEEAHWLEVESKLHSTERWIQVGKATSVHAGAPVTSHQIKNEELILGLNLPSENEDGQNDTDSSMLSPAQKRRKFRSIQGTYVPSLPQSLPNAVESNTTSRTSLTNDVEETYHPLENGQFINHHAGFVRQTSSLPDSGLGTISLSSTRKHSYLREKLAEIGRTLEKRPFMTETSDNSEDDKLSMSRQLMNCNSEVKRLKEEINQLEKEMEEKRQYISILEAFIHHLKELFQHKAGKTEKELLQNLETELEKAENMRGLDANRFNMNQDVSSLNSQLSKKDRELLAKGNKVDILEKELKQWQDECRTIEEMRTNALDAIRVLELEVANLQEAEKDLQKSKEAYGALHKKVTATENSKEDALMTVAPLRARITQLAQKCREKDSLLRRLGEELRKSKDVEKHLTILEELAAMESRMDFEEYNHPQFPTLHSKSWRKLSGRNMKGQPRNITVSMTDLDQPSSASSCADSQEYVAYSDTEAVSRGHPRKSRYRHPNHSSNGRDFRINRVKYRSRDLPHISKSAQSSSSFSDKTLMKEEDENLPVGYMPPDPMFVAVADYDPDLYSKSGRRAAEITLKEWDEVKVIGPLDETGYFEAVSNGLQGLVPAAYLCPAYVSDLVGQKSASQPRLQSHLDPSPEKIIQVHNQLKQSQSSLHQLQPTVSSTQSYQGSPSTSLQNGHIQNQPQTYSPVSQRNTSLYPLDPPQNFRIEKVINKQTIMLAWKPPSLTDNSYNNGIRVIGYKIYLNGKIHQHAQSPHIAKTIVKNLDTHHRLLLAIQTVGVSGQVSDMLQAVLERQDSNVGSDHNLDTDVYQTGRKRSFVGIYDFLPSPGKTGHELMFQAGDRITVYGEERMDGYYHGEIGGRRGLVPGFFMEEVPLNQSEV